VIVCGGRDYDDRKKLFYVLDDLAVQTIERESLTIVEGGARGADALAASWTRRWKTVKHEQYPADWAKYGKAAGAIRNQQMLDTGIDLVIAFPGGSGTAHMVRIARDAAVDVWEI
jgi:hypothetical protein